MKLKNINNKHHVRPTSRGGEDVPENKVILPKVIHRKWHSLFRELTPEEAIIWIKVVMMSGASQFSHSKLNEIYNKIEKR